MSLLTQRTAAVLQLALIDATPCGKCKHPLSEHGVSLRTPNYKCRHEDFVPNPKGYQHGNGKFKPCRCKGFVENEQLEIGARA